MSFKQDMVDDLSVFYNTKEFAISVLYKTEAIPALPVEDMEISDTREMVISCVSSDVLDIESGDIFTIDEKEYEVINFDFKDKYELETIIALGDV